MFRRSFPSPTSFSFRFLTSDDSRYQSYLTMVTTEASVFFFFPVKLRPTPPVSHLGTG